VTLFTHKSGELARLAEALVGDGVKEVAGFTRKL